MFLNSRIYLCALSALYFAGCVATTTDVDRLQGSLVSMEKTQGVMQKSQADLISKMDELDSSLSLLKERLDENQKKMGLLIQKLDDVQLKLGSRMEIISQLLSAATSQAAVPVPTDIYRTIYADYLAGRADLAITGFKEFLQKYPASDLAGAAQFYLADSYLTKQDFTEARVQFDKYLSGYTDMRAAALLKRSYSLAGLKRPQDQESTLATLVKEFPDSPESQTARQILSDIKSELKKEKSEQKPAHKKKGE